MMQLQVDCGFDVYWIVNEISVLVGMALLEPRESKLTRLIFCSVMARSDMTAHHGHFLLMMLT